MAAVRVGRCGQCECGSACVRWFFVVFFFFRWAGLARHERKAQRFEVIMRQLSLIFPPSHQNLLPAPICPTNVSKVLQREKK